MAKLIDLLQLMVQL